jgi:hypothetical protein
MVSSLSIAFSFLNLNFKIMKKIYLIVLSIIFSASAHAQYFQHIYGTPGYDMLQSGVNTTIQPQGHFMASFNKSICQMGVGSIPAAYSDINGNVGGAPFFEREYTIISGTGSILHARDPQVFELNNGSGFGIIGMYTDLVGGTGANGVYYLQLDPLGNPVATYDYPALPGSGFTFTVSEVGGVAKSTAVPDEVFVTGTVIDNTGQANVFALDINSASGALVWSQIYNILPPIAGPAWGRDVAMNPGLPFGTPSIAVVGQVYNNHGGPFSNDGFLMHLDAATGLPTHPIIIYGTPGSDDHLNSINACVGAPGPFPPGFILGGGTDINGSMDFYVLRMDFLIATFFFNTFDFSMVPGSTNDCHDVIERLNTACTYEYYAVGETDNGPFGNWDIMVVKMDQNGNGVAGGEFIYGSAGPDFGTALDVLNTGLPCAAPPMAPPAGLSIFGMWGGPPAIGLYDMYLIKAYYNGQSGCNEMFNTPLQGPAFPEMPHSPVINISNFGSGALSQAYNGMADITLCFNPTLGGGNNNMVASPDDKERDGVKKTDYNAVVLMPNPSENGNTNVTLKINSEVEGPANVNIYDMLGKQFYKGSITLIQGSNELPIDLSATNMKAGIYNVIITQYGKSQSTSLIIK